jgi:pyruvate/2-oxoglutarate dehydrogenase complex dihydrolipoamide acyltransferase (E2) component
MQPRRMANHKIYQFPKSRLATIDVCEVGKRKHHVTGLIELDVTEARIKIREHNKNNSQKVSFNSWIISVIGKTIKHHEFSAAFLKGKSKLMIFDDVNVSLIVEKTLNGQKVPMPLIIEKANDKSAEEILKQIEAAKSKELSKKDVVLHKKNNRLERLYYLLPGFARRFFWRHLLKRPKLAYKKMGNVAITSVGMMGRISGWFIPISIHPICFGLGSIIKKPVIIDNEIEAREMLSMSILMDHDVIDGAPMARFISQLSKNIEAGFGL